MTDPSLEITTLTLTPDNPCNTTLFASSGDALYSVVTESTKKTTFTTVRNAGDEIIGSLEWRDVLPDRVTIGASVQAVSLNEWVRKSRVPFKDYATFSDEQGRKYRWKGLTPGSSPHLCSEDDGYHTIIARFTRSRRLYILPTTSPGLTSPSAATLKAEDDRPQLSDTASMFSLSPTLTDTASISPTLTDASSDRGSAPQRKVTPATLEMLPRAREIQDLVVLSLLFLEKGRRMRDGGVSGDNVMYRLMAPGGAC